MQRATFLSVTLLGAFLGASFLITGCSPKPPPPKGNGKDDDGNKPAKPVVAIKAGKGKITGRIVYDGSAPSCKALAEVLDPKNAPACKSPEEYQNCAADSWHVGKDGGVADVLIYVKVPKGHYFEPSKADLDRVAKEVLWIKQPHCAFVPHMTAVWQYYLDNGKEKKTGQVLTVINDNMKATHNSQLSVNPFSGSVAGGETLGYDKTYSWDKLKQGVNPETKEPIDPSPAQLTCNVHTWMKAKIWAFDHPYARVTKVDGKFEIDNLPEQDLTVVFVHDSGYTEEVAVTGGKKDFGDKKIKAK